MGRVFGISIGLTDVLFPIGGVIKAVSGRDVFSNKDKAADEYVNYRMQSPLSFAGSNADLQALISSEIDSCNAYVKSKGVLVANSREVCANKIQLAYSDVIASRQAEEYANDQQATKQLFANSSLLWIVAAIVIIILIIIFKSDK